MDRMIACNGLRITCCGGRSGRSWFRYLETAPQTQHNSVHIWPVGCRIRVSYLALFIDQQPGRERLVKRRPGFETRDFLEIEEHVDCQLS